MSDIYLNHNFERVYRESPEPPDRIGKTTVTARTVTVYQVNGKGKRVSSRKAAYRRAAWLNVWTACLRQHDVAHHLDIPGGKTCAYCDPEKLTRGGDRYGVAVANRLIRWLKWRDSKAVQK